MKILIADDDPTSLSILTAVLQVFGHEVVALSDGAEALAALLKPDAPRLAILDWMMPSLTGTEVCRRVRAQKSIQPPYLILLTSRDKKQDVAEGLLAGADDYLIKPFDSMELNARVEVGCRIVTLQNRLADKVLELESALAQIKTLRGIIPICARCKRIRDDRGFWDHVETYISAHSEAIFSHSLCPDCLIKFYPAKAPEGKS